ncbi:MAG: nucleotidyltransferase family protein [Hyphomonadaceae bacterium]
MTSVLILAGSRREGCQLCLDAEVPSKALIPLGGVRMVDHMLRSLRDCPSLDGDIWISGLDVGALGKGAPADLQDFVKRIKPTAVGDGPAAATVAALDAGVQTPLLVTTCDHPLLTPEMISYVIEGAESDGCDLAVGLATRSVIQKAYPETKRTYLPLKPEGYSGCNLFLVRNKNGRKALDFWRSIGRDRKHPWKLARHLSYGTLFRMLLGRLNLDHAFAFGSRRVNAGVCPVIIPIAEAAIDVDKPSDLELVSSILAKAGKNG